MADDDIRSILESAASGETPPADAPPTPPELQPETPGAEPPPSTIGPGPQPRDDQGRFSAKEGGRGDEAPKRETLTLKQPPGVAPAVRTPDSQPKPDDVPPPQNWKGAGKINWQRLPQEIRREIADQHTRFEQERAQVAPIAEMLNENRQMLVAEGGSVVEGMRQLLNLARVAVANPVALIHYIARQRRIDLASVVGLPGQTGAPPQPGIQPGAPSGDPTVHQRIAQLESLLQEQRDSDIHGRIQAFSSNPAYPYFNDVRQTMGHLMMAGSANTLEEAYEMATWGTPAVRAQLQAAEATKSQGANAEAVQRARAAQSASLTGSPLPGGGSRPNGLAGDQDSIRGALMAAFNDQRGAV